MNVLVFLALKLAMERASAAHSMMGSNRTCEVIEAMMHVHRGPQPIDPAGAEIV